MKRTIVLLPIAAFILIILFCQVVYAATSIVILRNGRTLEISHYVIEGDSVHLILENPPDSAIVISRDEIEKIVPKEEDVSEDGAEFIDKLIGAKFVLIPAGTFIMGSPSAEGYSAKSPSSDTLVSNEAQHPVKLTEPFYLQTTIVTQRQWKKVMKENPSYFNNCDDCPVENVSWNKASLFISVLNGMEKTNKYRLPTEAEWEYAARAGTTTKFYTGNCLATYQANYRGNYPFSECPKGIARYRTTPVRSFRPNDWGLYDMHGNVWQWVNDVYGGNHGLVLQIDPVGRQIGEKKVIRGGGWDSSAAECRSASRSYLDREEKRPNIGFRIAKIPYWSSPTVHDEKTARFSNNPSNP